VDPRRRNTVSFQRTLGFNDWYLAGPDNPYPPGNLQMLGKIQGPMVKAARPWVPMPLLTYMTNHSIDTNSHQCGTAVMSADPRRSVLDPTCRAHDVDNPWVVDSACFPSSAALNPALTIAANALRVAAVSDLTG
jgi:choline dehydrogenase-like flavoprotein